MAGSGRESGRLRRAAHAVAATSRRWETWVVVLGVLPVVVAFVRSLVDHWMPMGEDALIALRAHDVLTADHPLLGTFSSASLTSNATVNHPGPLLFDVLALPVRLFGSDAGTALGVALVHVVAIVVAARAALAAGGRTLLVWVVAGALGLEWTLGSSLLVDPWNPHVVLLAFYAMLVCAAAFAVGQRWTLGWMIGFGSFALQTHITYAVLVPSVVATSLLAAWWYDRTRRRSSDVRPVQRWRPAVMVAAVWTVVLWAQPLWQQVVGPGPGNITALLRSASDPQPRVGLGVAARLVARVVALPPTWTRTSFLDSLQDLRLHDVDGGALPLPGWLPTSSSAVLALGFVIAVLVAVGVLSARARRRDALAAVALSIVCIVAAIWSTSSVPAGGYGIAPHQLRWLWPIAVFWMVTVAAAVTPLVRAWFDRRGSDVSARRLVPGVLLLTFGAALAGCGKYDPPTGVARAPGSMASVRAIVGQVRQATFPPVLLDGSGLYIGEPYTGPVLERLYLDGRAVFVDHQQAAQVGRRREVTDDVRLRLSLRAGPNALVCGAGEERIALTTPWSAADVATFEAGQRDVIELAASLATRIEPEVLDGWAELHDALASPAATVAFVTSGGFAALATGPDLPVYLDDDELASIAADQALRSSVGIDTVGVFVDARDGDITWNATDHGGVLPGVSAAICP